MKKSFKIIGMAAMVLLLAVSCKKENKDDVSGETKAMTFTAGIGQGNGKTYLDGSKLLWSGGDVININGNPFTLTEGEGTNKGVFNGEAEEKDLYYAVYPASNTLDNDIATITLPAEQPYVDGSFAMGVAPMVAMTGDNKSFTFTNVCGLLRLDFQSITEPVKKIKLESAKNEYLAGEGTVEIMGDGNEVFVLTDDSGNSKAITMEIADGITDQHQIVFVLPAGTLTTGFNAYFYAEIADEVPFDNISTGANMGIVAGQMNVVTVSHMVEPQAATITQDACTASSLTIPYEIKEECETARIQCATDAEFTNIVGTIAIVGSKDSRTGSVTFEGLSASTLYYVRILVKIAGDSEEKPYCTIVAETLGGDDELTIPGNALSGLFSVGEGKQVFFAKGNLWYGEDENGKGKSFHFEENQWNYVTGEFNQTAALYKWNENHVSHFFSSNNADVACAESYSDPTAANGDVFFTNCDATTPNSAFTVDGETGVWRTLSGTYGSSEWDYLINQRDVNGGTGYGHTCVYATVKNDDGEDVKGLIIFCDDYKGSTTNLTSVPDGCVFLLAAGTRNFVNGCSLLDVAGYDGYYASSTTLTKTLMNYFKFTESGYISANGVTINRSQACPVRLVRDYAPSK